jgi:glutathione S-transferase
MNRSLDVTSSGFASLFSLGMGTAVTTKARKPEKLLELYEFEACPYCRKVRAVLSNFDLEAMIYPCPRGSRHRAVVKEKGGKEQFPFLVDPNTGKEMYESDEIIRYLADTYGNGSVPKSLSLGPATVLFATLASATRGSRGSKARPAKAPSSPLELWSFEVSPFSRIVREALCELQIPYHLHNVAKGSPSREAFVKRSGKMMVPYLVDPNTGKEMFESAEIVAYLEKTYGEGSGR